MKATDSFALKKVSALLLGCVGLMLLASCAAKPIAEVSSEGASRADAQETVDDKQAAAPDKSELAADEKNASEVSDSHPVADLATADLATINLEVGMTYAEARAALMQQGWEPIAQPDPGPYGVERTLYDVGFTEVSACSGTGVGACNFSFYHPAWGASEDNRLGVTTYGGSSPEVADWSSHFVEGVPPVAVTVAASSNAVTGAGSIGADSATAQSSTIPTQFLGLWNFSVEECSTPYGQGRLSIEPDRLSFYESSGPVTDVVVQGASEVTISTELSSEGTTFTDTRTFQLSEEGTSLIDTSYDSVRYRCPNS